MRLMKHLPLLLTCSIVTLSTGCDGLQSYLSTVNPQGLASTAPSSNPSSNASSAPTAPGAVSLASPVSERFAAVLNGRDLRGMITQASTPIKSSLSSQITQTYAQLEHQLRVDYASRGMLGGGQYQGALSGLKQRKASDLQAATKEAYTQGATIVFDSLTADARAKGLWDTALNYYMADQVVTATPS